MNGRWLVSAPFDLAVFGGSALLAFVLLAIGPRGGAAETPLWAFVAAVVFVDVAHVWSTAYRVYLDPEERGRRPGLYLGVPLAVYVVGVLLHSVSSLTFWTVLAYTAVWHFVRQQYGWLALYRRRVGITQRLDVWLDDAAVYTGTLYPVLWWHAHLPRQFAWFVDGDFIRGVPPALTDALAPVVAAILLLWLLRQAVRVQRGGPANPGGWLVMLSTWATWFVGIVVLDSDYAFTVTNVLVHGIPYVALVGVWGRSRFRGEASTVSRLFQLAPAFVLPLLAVAWLEEWAWDRLVWHDHAALFAGPAVVVPPALLALLVPLLALPQATHYVLDAWIWRTRENPGLARHLGF